MPDAKLAILVSCIGRKLLLGQRTADEVEAVADVLGKGCLTTGFYSYGEIALMKVMAYSDPQQPDHDHHHLRRSRLRMIAQRIHRLPPAKAGIHVGDVALFLIPAFAG